MAAVLALVLLAISSFAHAESLESQGGDGPAGGSAYVVVTDPAAPGTVYAGTQRGVFKSVDGGASWVFSSAGLPPTRVQALAIDPGNPGTLYAGTRTPDGVASVGLFKSTDGGATWSDANVGLADPVLDIGPLDVESIAVSPADSNLLMIGTAFSELFRSGDAGQTWSPVTFGGNQLGIQTTAIVFGPVLPTRVYAASSIGFLRSDDSGVTWVLFGDAPVPFYSLAADPSTTTLYAGDANGSGIWKSTDAGSHWTSSGSLPGGSGSQPPVLSLAVDLTSPSTLYAGTYGSGVFVSRDSGATWSAAGSGMRDDRISSVTVSASGEVYAGTYGGGVYSSEDGGRTWTRSVAGFDAAMIGAVLLDPSVSGVVYAATSNGVAVSESAGAEWSETGSGLPSVAVSALALAGAGSPRLLAGTLGDGLFQSTDRGSTWTSPAAGLADSYISSLAVDPSSAGTVFAGTAHPYTGANSERVFKSADGGATWSQTSLDAGQFSVDFIVVAPGHQQIVAGSAGVSGIFRSLDGGGTWSTISTGSCGGLYGAALDGSGSTIYLAGSSGVCRSSDGGATWTAALVGGGLFVTSILVDPANPGTLYAGTAPDLAGGIDGAVFVSDDGGVTFEPLEPALAPGVDALALDSALGIVYAGTSGAGVAPLHLLQSRELPAPPAAARPSPRKIGPR